MRHSLNKKNSLDEKMLLFRSELKKEVDQSDVKRYADQADITTKFKALEEEFNQHKLDTKHNSDGDHLARLKNIAWGFTGVGAAAFWFYMLHAFNSGT